MANELALQKLEEVREVVDGEMAEMVDSLASLLLLRQDISNPMFGAKVMFYEKPEGKWVQIDYDEFREHYPDDLPDDPEDGWSEKDPDEVPWWLRWVRKDDNYKSIDEGEIEHEFRRYLKYDEERTIDEDEVPDPLSPDNDLSTDIELAEEVQGKWTIYDVSDGRRYKHTPLVPCKEFVARRAIVVEPHIAEQPAGTDFWDPNRGEYTTPDDYPMGTVNVVLPDDPDKEFGEDYTYDMRVETSVTPAKGNPGSHQYTPGWD